MGNPTPCSEPIDFGRLTKAGRSRYTRRLHKIIQIIAVVAVIGARVTDDDGLRLSIGANVKFTLLRAWPYKTGSQT